MAMKDAYTARELSEVLLLSRQAVDLRAARENWQSRKRAGRGGGKEWIVASMPAITATAIQAAEAAQATELAQYTAPAPAVIPADAVVPDWALVLAKARYRIVAEWRAHTAKQHAAGVSKKDATQAFVTAYNAGFLLPNAHEQVEEISLPTLYRWDSELKAHHDDLMALADKRGKWRQGGAKGLGQIGSKAEGLFLQAYLQTRKPTMQMAYRAVVQALEALGLPVPSYSGVRRFFERFDAVHHDVVVLGREGEKALDDKVGKYLGRDDRILRVGDVLVSDGHKMNFTIINPDTGKPARYTLIGWQDWASRMFVSFEIMLEENTQAIAASFQRAIVMLGKVPRIVLIDNGKAFKNEFFEAETDIKDMDGLYQRLGIHVAHSAPYVGRAKVIERWWGDFDRQCAVAMDSYIGASIDSKPAHLMRNEKWVKARQTGWVPTLEDVRRMVTDFAKWKALQPHPTRPGVTPWEVFSAGRGKGFNEDERAALARDFMHRRTITPRRCRFTMMGVTFESDALYGINKELIVYYAYADLSEVYVYDDGRLVTVARPVESVHPMARLLGDELDMEKLRAAQKQQAKLRADTRKMAAQIGNAGAELLMGLPFMQGVAERRQPMRVVQGGKAELPPQDTPIISAEERAELVALVAHRKAEAAARPAYTSPAFFSSELERYDFLFTISTVEGTPLTQEDAAFMRAYEASEEYLETTGRRYEQLRRLCPAQTKEAAV